MREGGERVCVDPKLTTSRIFVRPLPLLPGQLESLMPLVFLTALFLLYHQRRGPNRANQHGLYVATPFPPLSSFVR